MSKQIEKLSMEFGKKEKVLNYTCQTYQLSRPNKVGAVMDLIRQCQPKNFAEWERFYFEEAFTASKVSSKVTKESLHELGVRLYEKITTVVVPEWMEAFQNITQDDCVDYIFNLTLNRTFDGYQREKSVVNDNLVKLFPEVRFEESPSELDHAGDIDYLGYVGQKAFGIQIKPITANANFGNYSPTERMKRSFTAFEQDFGGKVFVVYSVREDVANKDVIKQIALEVTRLNSIK